MSRIAPIVFALGVLPWSTIHAQQYQSEARVVSQTEAASVKDFDAEKALQEVSDPYARSMLLSQIAAQAHAEGQSEQALAYLQKAIKLNALSEFAQSRLQIDAGMIAAYLGRDTEVIKLLANVEELKDASALRQLTAAYARRNSWREAGKIVRKLMQAPKPTPDDRVLDATVAAANKDWPHVLQRTAEVLELSPRNADAWLLRVKAHLGLNNQQRALADRRAAWRLGVLVNADQRRGLVRAFADAGVPLTAASLLEEGLTAGEIERSPESLDQLASLWLKAREYTDARAILTERLAIAPSAEASVQLGQLALNAGDWNTAARHLSLGMGLDSAQRRGAVAMMLGQAEFQRGRHDAAEAAFRRAATIRRFKASAEQWIEYLASGQASAGAVAGTAVQQAGASRVHAGRLRGAGTNPAQRVVRSFTDVGAEAHPNADGRIPAFAGQPDDPRALEQSLVEEQPIALITRDTMKDWGPWLSAGHQELLKNNPKFRMPVYSSQRVVDYPEAIRQATQKNRGRAKLLGSDAIGGAKLGFPFPSPENGVEAMWNHRLRWRGEAFQRTSKQTVVRPDGSTGALLVQYEEALARYANISSPADLARENILLYYLTTFGRGKNTPDFTVLVHESANSLERARSIWALPRNYKKMFRIPPVGYDNPFPGSDGLFYVDMVDMYNGAFDHYDWKLAGKRELLIGYNAFKAQQFEAGAGPKGLLRPGAVNSDALRYEVHRVWVVEASERSGKSHIFGVRRFFLDEDSWNVVLVENYDRVGQLWRIQEGHLLPNFAIQAADSAPVVTYDLSDGRYFIRRMADEFGPVRPTEREVGVRDYRPATVKNRFAR